VSARGFGYLNKNIEDVVFLTLTFSNGVCAHIHVSWLDPQKIRRVTLVGSRKMLVYDDVSPDEKIMLFDRQVEKIPTSGSPQDFRDFAEFQLKVRSGDILLPHFPFKEPLHVECEHFVDCIRTGKTPLTDGQHGLQVVRVLEAADRSIKKDGLLQKV
jgi:predicted dehydrogenase